MHEYSRAHTHLCEDAEEVFTIALSLSIVSYFSLYLDLGRRGRWREEDKMEKREPSTEITLRDVITTGKALFGDRSALQWPQRGFI